MRCRTKMTQGRSVQAQNQRASRTSRLLGGLALLAAALLAAYAGIWGFAQGAGITAFQSGQADGIPLEINHQGFIREGGAVFNGIGDFRFALLVDPDTDTNLWTNDGSHIGDSGMPTAAVAIEVEKGDYSVRLGNTGLPNMVEIPTSVFEDDNVVLRIWFDDRKHGVEQLEPDHVLTSAPYAYRAADATRADHAAAADHAATADHATEAAHATTADTATEADHAATADDAAHAAEADHATTADEAAHAAEADHAATASTADKLKKPELPAGLIAMWSGTIADIPDGWALCDGRPGTPDLRDKFIVGAKQDHSGVAKTNVKGSLMVTGGEHQHTLTVAEIPPHTHTENGHQYYRNKGASDWGDPIGCPLSTQTGSRGGGQPHENCPPFYALAFIMKL